jgi:hypothetical protein
MRLNLFFIVLSFMYVLLLPLTYNSNNQSISENKFKLTDNFPDRIDISHTEEGQYILHKDKIDSEIQLLKDKYPVFKYDFISYKFLFTPKQGYKQFFESDGSPFIVIKIYSRNVRPGDMITISDVKYKDPTDSTSTWKNFETKLLFVFE